MQAGRSSHPSSQARGRSEAARRDYGVAIDLERWTVDEVETARLRTLPPPPDALPVGDAPGPRPLVDAHA